MEKNTKQTLSIFGISSGIIILVLLIWFLGPSFAKVDAKRSNDIKQEYIIQDARVRVSTYEWFYQQYEEIESQKRKIEIMGDTPEAKLMSLVLQDMIGEYNAKAKMRETKAQWMPEDLPYQID